MGTACRHAVEDDRDKRKKKNGAILHGNEGNDHRLKPSKPVPIEDGMHFFLGSYRAGGAVVKAKMLSPKSASVRRCGSRNGGSKRDDDDVDLLEKEDKEVESLRLNSSK